MILWDPSKKGTAWNQFQIAAGAIVMATGLMFSGCDATHETTVSADQSRREVSEQSGVLSKVNVPPPRLTIPSGTNVPVRLLHSINSRSARPKDSFDAELAAPVQVEQRIAFPRGSRVRGRVIEAQPSGRLEDPGYLRLTIEAIQSTDGRWVDVNTTYVSAKGGSHNKRNTTLIAGGAGLGALVGGIAGGGKGAAIGAVSGAGAGTAGAYATGKKEASFSAEQKLNFAIKEELTMTR